MKLYLIDVSGFLFRAYFALPPITNPQGIAIHALFGFIRSILKFIKQEQPQHIVAVYDGPDNKKSRKALYAEYKANRTAEYEDLPEQMAYSKIFCELLGIDHIEIEGVEADDTIGSLTKWALSQNMEVRICSADKDLCQLVSEHVILLHPWKDYAPLDSRGVEEKFGVKPAQIPDYLGLIGDSSDHIPGVPGFGPKTAAPLLQTFGNLEELLSHIDQVKGQKKQEALKEHAAVALLSKQLATLDCDLSLPITDDLFTRKPVQEVALKAFYLEHGFQSLLKELETLSPPKRHSTANHHIVDNPTSLDTLIVKLRNSSEIACSVLTNGNNPPIGIACCIDEGNAYYIPFNSKIGAQACSKITPILEESSCFGHDTKAMCHALAHLTKKSLHISFDTILASYVLNPSAHSHDFDFLVLERLGKVRSPLKSLLGKPPLSVEQLPLDIIGTFCCEEVEDLFHLKKILESELQKRNLESLFYHLELPLSAILRKMEEAGVYLDCGRLHALAEPILKELKTIEQTIYHLAGEEFNLNSPKQLSAILFEKLSIKPLKKTASGYSTNADVLEELSKEYPIASHLLAYRTLEKLRSTYIETLPKQVSPQTHRIHPTFNQFTTATGRLACHNPNLQNIPTRHPIGKQIRTAFRPMKEGWSYLSADYSQIELRLLAHLSGDPALIEAFLKGKDVHHHTAALMFGNPEVTEAQRHQAKAINFGIIYGQQAYGLARELKIEVSQAAHFIQEYYNRYPLVLAYQKQCIAQTQKTGRAVTMVGRERMIPEIHSRNSHIRAAAERLAVNTPLQGSAADLIKKAMLDADRKILKEKFKAFLILQLHDELIFEVPDEELKALSHTVRTCMEEAFSLKVPLIVNVSIGKNWGEC